MSGPNGMMVQMSSPYVRGGEPLQKSTLIAIVERPLDRMPIIGPQTATENSHQHLLLSFRKDIFKGSVIFRLFKDRIERVSSIQKVKDHSIRRIVGCWRNVAARNPFGWGRR